MFKELVFQEDEYLINSFINSNNQLEFNIYKQIDGGFLDLEDRKYTKDELLELLMIELKIFKHH